jgi:creatinine amidohydrolase
VRIADLNWMQVEAYLERDDRIVLPIGSTEQHGYLSLAVDLILAERVSVDAAEPLGVPVLPVMPFGVAPGFTAYPGTVSLRIETLVAVLREALDSLYGQGFRRFLVVNGHGGNTGAEEPLLAWAGERDGAALRFHSWWASERTTAAAEALYPNPTHANWFENFPWTRLEGVAIPAGEKPMAAVDEMGDDPAAVRATLGDGTFGGAYERPDEEMLKLWSIAVEEARELLESGWPADSG